MITKTIIPIHKKALSFANLTKSFLQEGNYQRAKRCLNYADRLLCKGSKEVKNSISNVDVFSLSIFMETHSLNVDEFFPQHLKEEYIKQINASGL
ncbi:MAG: hypothetical protein IPO65_18670 [Saprospiraceae bacterium]|nr:hypothetical protein [Saprospiraceae bacterium]